MDSYADQRKEIYKNKDMVIIVESAYPADGQTIKEIIKNMLFKKQGI